MGGTSSPDSTGSVSGPHVRGHSRSDVAHSGRTSAPPMMGTSRGTWGGHVMMAHDGTGADAVRGSSASAGGLHHASDSALRGDTASVVSGAGGVMDPRAPRDGLAPRDGHSVGGSRAGSGTGSVGGDRTVQVDSTAMQIDQTAETGMSQTGRRPAPLDQGYLPLWSVGPVNPQSGSRPVRSPTRPAPSLAPGTQFSRVQQLWRKRAGVAASQRRSPSRASKTAASVLQSSIAGIEDRVQHLAQQSATALEETRAASAKALHDIQTELGGLRTAQSRQSGQVQELDKEVCRVHHESTRLSVAADLQARTGQSAMEASVEKKL